MLFPLKMALFLREIALFYTKFDYKLYNLWSKVVGHNSKNSEIVDHIIWNMKLLFGAK